MKLNLYTKICLAGIAFTLLATSLLTLVDVPFYMTGHLILPWIIALVVQSLIQKK